MSRVAEYVQIVEEVFHKKPKEYLVIGKTVKKYNSLELALGKPVYLADYINRFKELLWLKTVRSPYAHAKIKRIDFSEALKLKGVVGVVTADDVPGSKNIGYVLPDQPVLAYDKVRYHGEGIAIIAAVEKEIAEEAVSLVKVEYEPLPVLLDPLKALKPDAPKIHDKGNILTRFKIRRGNIEEGFSKADAVVEGEYRVNQQEHAYIETEGVIAIPEPDGTITLIINTQCPFDVRRDVSRATGLSFNKIRVIVPMIGGGFGGKEDVLNIIGARAAIAAMKFRKPVVLIHDREECVLDHSKRHAGIMRYKHGATKDGKLVAVQGEIILDTGAYASLGPFVLWRATVHSVGPYVVPNAKIDSVLVYTNKLYAGAFRGFGCPQVAFAVERQMDKLAEKLGMDPLEFRLKNILREGDQTVHGQLLDHSVGLEDILERLGKASNWKQKRAEYEKFNRETKGVIRKGIGLAIWWHGNSIGAEGADYSSAVIIINRDGTITYRTNITDFGNASPQGHIMIVSEILGVPLEYIHIERPDTSAAPDAGPTVASRGQVMGGNAALVAAYKLRQRLNQVAADMLECSPDEVVIKAPDVYCKSDPSKRISWRDLVEECFWRGVPLQEIGYYRAPRAIWDDETGQGQPYFTYTYVGAIAEVEVDIETGKVRVTKLYGAFDIGKVINRVGLELHAEGGAIMSMGYALTEEVKYDENGLVMNPNLYAYYVPTILDVPDSIEYEFIEAGFKRGPFGAKGFGEPSVEPWHPAIANAIAYALKVDVNEIPATPERIYRLLKKAGLLKI